MAPQVQLDLRVGLRLEALGSMLADLPDVAREWPDLSAAERASWSLDWDQAMGALQAVLGPAYSDANMSSEQQACYRKVLADLQTALPHIRTLQLAVPRVRTP